MKFDAIVYQWHLEWRIISSKEVASHFLAHENHLEQHHVNKNGQIVATNLFVQWIPKKQNNLSPIPALEISFRTLEIVGVEGEATEELMLRKNLMPIVPALWENWWYCSTLLLTKVLSTRMHESLEWNLGKKYLGKQITQLTQVILPGSAQWMALHLWWFLHYLHYKYNLTIFVLSHAHKDIRLHIYTCRPMLNNAMDGYEAFGCSFISLRDVLFYLKFSPMGFLSK